MVTVPSSSPQKTHESSRLGPVGLRFRSILVATDYSPASATAVKLAARIAKEFHARLYVLHAIEPDLYAINMARPVPELALMNLRIAHEGLHKYAEHIPELRTVKHKELVFLGSPNDAIQSAGQENSIDLLVLGSHGRNGLLKLALGSVAEWAINRLTYPVLVAGPMCEKMFPPIRSIVLATDFAAESSCSVQYAGSLAQDYNSRLTVMHVLPPTGTPEEQQQVELRTLGKLRELLPSDRAEWCSMKYQVKTGDIATAIIGSGTGKQSEFDNPVRAAPIHSGRSPTADQTICNHPRRTLPCTCNSSSLFFKTNCTARSARWIRCICPRLVGPSPSW